MTLKGIIAHHGNNSIWPEVKLGSILSQRKVTGMPDLPLLGVSLHEGVRMRVENDGRPAASQDLSSYKLVEESNVVMNRLGKPHGSVGVSVWRGITSPAYWVMSIDERAASPRFVHHLLRSNHLVKEYGRLGKFMPPNQFDISWEDFRSIEVPLPPLEEQRRIADFLDAETDLLDRAMERMRTQLALLEERELADVYATVSGARISGARKASGMDWLGDIPIDWPVASVSSQFQVQLGKMLNQERTRGARLRPYLRVLNVQWDRVDVTELVEMDFPESERARYEVLPGDLLICEGGIAGRAAIWDGKIPEIYYQKALHRARSRGRSSVRWLYYCLRLALAMGVFQAEGNSSTITHLTGEQLASRRFPFPNSEVQNRLVVELDKESERRRVLREAREKQIELLEERRRAVVTAAVTGELDVTMARGVSSV